MVQSGEKYNKLPALSCIDPKLRMNFDSILNKPFLVGTFTFKTTDTSGTIVGRVNLPSSILANDLGSVPFYSSALHRMRLCAQVQLRERPCIWVLW
jgi:hypothetical protein